MHPLISGASASNSAVCNKMAKRSGFITQTELGERSRLGRNLRACCPNPFPFRMWGRHSCLPVLGTFQSPDSASNCQLWFAKLENFATGRLESPPYNFGNTPSRCARSFCAVLIGTLEKCCNPGCWPDVRSRIASHWLNLKLSDNGKLPMKSNYHRGSF